MSEPDFEAEARRWVWEQMEAGNGLHYTDTPPALADFARRMFEAGYRSRDKSVGALSQAHRDFRADLLALAERCEGMAREHALPSVVVARSEIARELRALATKATQAEATNPEAEERS